MQRPARGKKRFHERHDDTVLRKNWREIGDDHDRCRGEESGAAIFAERGAGTIDLQKVVFY